MVSTTLYLGGNAWSCGVYAILDGDKKQGKWAGLNHLLHCFRSYFANDGLYACRSSAAGTFTELNKQNQG
ncbi:hypothetical protein [Anaerotruncus colihominis]|uniref:hypothetical protein n=1 Tax=Anaerotruncus colihominis TaxID=169435 RepID=UPI001121ED15|nr:hypothetical protein [Anaerotruncus colihominis]